LGLQGLQTEGGIVINVLLCIIAYLVVACAVTVVVARWSNEDADDAAIMGMAWPVTVPIVGIGMALYGLAKKVRSKRKGPAE
jgi:hypothetical protein